MNSSQAVFTVRPLLVKYNNFAMYSFHIPYRHEAVPYSFLVMCVVLFMETAVADSQAYLKAMKKENLDTIGQMISLVDDIDIRLDDGRTALMLASKYGREDITRNLLHAGADVNATNNNGGTALMYSAIRANLPTVQLLLANGAKVNMKAKFGWTALMVAASKGRAEIIRELLAHGANANTRDTYQWTPLIRASHLGHATAVRELLNHPNTDMNARDENGATALHHAATDGYYDVAVMLIEAEATLDIEDVFGFTPGQRAAKRENYDIYNLLRDALTQAAN